MQFDKKAYGELFHEYISEGRIVDSGESFKIKLFMDKGTCSLAIASHHKDMKTNQHEKLHWDYWAVITSYYSMLYAAKAAILKKGYEVKDHMSAQIAIGYLLVPDEMEKGDLELLGHSYKIFEAEYVEYFEDARTESYNARYAAVRKYSERRLTEIFGNAQKFVSKIDLVLN